MSSRLTWACVRSYGGGGDGEEGLSAIFPTSTNENNDTKMPSYKSLCEKMESWPSYIIN